MANTNSTKKVFPPKARARIVSGWRRQRASLTQDQFLAKVAAETGTAISARTLRSWLSQSPDAGAPAESARKLVDDALEAVGAVHRQLLELRAGLDAEPAAAEDRGKGAAAPVCPPAPAAVSRPTAPAPTAVQSRSSQGPEVGPVPSRPAAPESAKPRTKFRWTLDDD